MGLEDQCRIRASPRLSTITELQSFAGGGVGPITGSLTPERQLAIERLKNKCRGFVGRGRTPARELVAALRQRGRQLDAPEFRAESADELPDEETRIRTLVLSRSPVAKRAGLNLLTHRLDDPGRPPVAGMAAMLALCDLGQDCGPASYSSSLRCALGGQCGQGLWDDWREGLAEADMAAVEAMRQRIVDAVTRGDLSGLVREPDR